MARFYLKSKRRDEFIALVTGDQSISLREACKQLKVKVVWAKVAKKDYENMLQILKNEEINRLRSGIRNSEGIP